jgi:hypothetical protein
VVDVLEANSLPALFDVCGRLQEVV